MAYVIAEPCIGTKDTACVDVCPVDCIHPRKDEPGFDNEKQLYINPAECIDCGACVPVCPVTAIFALEDLPEKWQSFTPVNADFYAKKETARNRSPSLSQEGYLSRGKRSGRTRRAAGQALGRMLDPV